MNFNKNIAIIDYFIKFLTKFATDSVSEEAEAASQNQHLLMVDFCPPKKGVIEILYLVFKLGRLKLCEDNLTMAPTSVAIPTPERDFVYAHGVGLSSYLHSR